MDPSHFNSHINLIIKACKLWKASMKKTFQPHLPAHVWMMDEPRVCVKLSTFLLSLALSLSASLAPVVHFLWWFLKKPIAWCARRSERSKEEEAGARTFTSSDWICSVVGRPLSLTLSRDCVFLPVCACGWSSWGATCVVSDGGADGELVMMGWTNTDLHMQHLKQGCRPASASLIHRVLL